jgi:hypothetical protein
VIAFWRQHDVCDVEFLLKTVPVGNGRTRWLHCIREWERRIELSVGKDTRPQEDRLIPFRSPRLS